MAYFQGQTVKLREGDNGGLDYSNYLPSRPSKPILRTAKRSEGTESESESPSDTTESSESGEVRFFKTLEKTRRGVVVLLSGNRRYKLESNILFI